jgi:signal transduction histidine kinase
MKISNQLKFSLILLTVLFTVFLYFNKNNNEHIQYIKFDNITLPYTLVKSDVKQEINANASPHLKITGDNNYLYLPNINGQLTLKANHTTLYQDYEYIDTAVLTSRSILIKIPDSIDFISTIDLNINDINKSLINISSLEIGKYSDFILRHQISNYYYNDFNNFTLGIAAFVFFVSCIFYFKNTNSFVTYHIPLISLYIAVTEIINQITILHKYIYVPATFAALILLIFFDWINQSHKEKIKIPPYLYFILSIIPITVCIYHAHSLEFNFGAYNLYYNLPTTIVICTIFIAYSIKQVFLLKNNKLKYTKDEKKILLAQSSPLIFLVISLAQGILAKFSFIDTGFYLIPLVEIYFLLILGVISVIYESVYVKKENEKYKQLLNQKKNELTLQLTHRNESEKLKALHMQKETFFTELHDGVLGHLSIIHSIAERHHEDDYNQIQKLSKYSINEIRLMLEIDLDVHQQYETLFITCSLLRQQIVEPLSLLGVHITWNMTKLLEYKKTSASFNLDIFRVLQEAIHNAHQRAEAKAIIVVSFCQDDKFFITVKNLRGMTFEPNYSRGFGISNMISRCKNIDCIFSITPLPGGAELTIALP